MSITHGRVLTALISSPAQAIKQRISVSWSFPTESQPKCLLGCPAMIQILCWWDLDCRSHQTSKRGCSAQYVFYSGVHHTFVTSEDRWEWVSFRREIELWLRPPTTAISVLKFWRWRSFCRRDRSWKIKNKRNTCGSYPISHKTS